LIKAEDVADGLISQAAFKKIEDWAVDEAVALQEEAGLEVVTDGECIALLPEPDDCRSGWLWRL
jgi:methionine synthase II (cobalamin-independent)